MAIVTTNDQHYSDIADAIRAKGVSGSFSPAQMPAAIESIEGGGATITDGIVVKAIDSDGCATEVDFYGASVGQYQFGGSRTDANARIWSSWLEKLEFKSVLTSIAPFAFMTCGRNAANHFPIELPASCTSVGGGAFKLCGFSSITCYASDLSGASETVFSGANLTSLFLPFAVKYHTNSSYGTFRGATALTEVQLGSVGHGITQIGQPARDCVQNGLVITAYCSGAYADVCLTGLRSGATNATIIIKASEATTYGGTSYAAGETMITSTP